MEPQVVADRRSSFEFLFDYLSVRPISVPRLGLPPATDSKQPATTGSAQISSLGCPRDSAQ